MDSVLRSIEKGNAESNGEEKFSWTKIMLMI